MKMVKKVLLGLAAAATIMAFFGCKMEDDPEGAITGSGNNYSVDYTNTDAKNEYRAYKSTSLKHAGALVKIKFDNPGDCENSKMGVIFDLKENEKNKDAKDFYIIGIGTSSLNFYVSKYTGIVDIQAKNFGAPTNGTVGENGEQEVEYFALGNSGITNLPDELYVYCKAKVDGSYEFALLKGEPTDGKELKINDIDITDLPDGVSLISLPNTNKNGCTVSGKVGKIPDAIPVPESGKESDIQQNKIAVYARIDANTTLKGSWKFCGTYKEAEEIEE